MSGLITMYMLGIIKLYINITNEASAFGSLKHDLWCQQILLPVSKFVVSSVMCTCSMRGKKQRIQVLSKK